MPDNTDHDTTNSPPSAARTTPSEDEDVREVGNLVRAAQWLFLLGRKHTKIVLILTAIITAGWQAVSGQGQVVKKQAELSTRMDALERKVDMVLLLNGIDPKKIAQGVEP